MKNKYISKTEMFDIFDNTMSYCIVGHGIYLDIDTMLCEYVAEKLFMEDKKILWILPTRIFERESMLIQQIKDELIYYGIGIGNVNIIVTNVEDFNDIQLEDHYDYLIVNNNSFIDNSKQLDEFNFCDKIIVTTVDYEDCIYYKSYKNKYILENPDIEKHINKFNKEHHSPTLRRAVEGKFDDYNNFFDKS